jgi:hypothetical protein
MVKYSKITHPTIPVGHPEYKWQSHSDVQATWMRLTNWRPIYTNQPPKYVEPKGDSFVTVLAKHRRAG